ncbi:hypothetical protein HPB51_017053 [Rhipicephalus microplus]|uniref:Uncharacterized protein n=1 Tax=Rhipicephalus microplus TaxID=6941 RepID=A0A9J6F7L2_RHIMP|nr:hypothetical protein HPB51_017053 [Rhipicephalus microplus]
MVGSSYRSGVKKPIELERLALEGETARRQEEAAAHEREIERLRLELRIVLAKRAGGQAAVNEEIQDRPGTINLERAVELGGECGVHCQSEMTSVLSMTECQGDSVVIEGFSRLGADVVPLTEQEECADALVKPERPPEVLSSVDSDMDRQDCRYGTLNSEEYNTRLW